MKVLAFDPGKSNWAWALVENGRVRDHGFLQNLIKSFADLDAKVKLFQSEVRELVAKAELSEGDYCALERFMHRPGQGKGAVGEFVNVQIGLLVSCVPSCYMIPAAVWKNHMTKHYGSNDTRALLDPRGKRELTPYEADAIGIALYCFEIDYRKRYLKLAWRK